MNTAKPYGKELPFVPEDLQDMGSSDIKMDEIVGKLDILMLCLDTLRWDVAKAQQASGGTPVLNRYGDWVESFASGNFTYPSHHAMFLGFLPAPVTARTITQRRMLFFPKSIGMGKFSPPGAFAYEGASFIQGLAGEGYQTNCIGGVSFFDKRSPIGRVFPNMFQHSFWRPSFGCGVKESVDNQVAFTCKRLGETPAEQRVFYYINICAIHYPNWFYLWDKQQPDSVESHAAALRYVDSRLEPLFQAFRTRGGAFVMALSDHGSCYGEDGFQFHGLPNPIVDTVPYKHFLIP